jgi:hypothetical protein
VASFSKPFIKQFQSSTKLFVGSFLIKVGGTVYFSKDLYNHISIMIDYYNSEEFFNYVTAFINYTKYWSMNGEQYV